MELFGLKKALELYAGKTFSNPLYIGLLYSRPAASDTTFDEPTAASYERVLINNASSGSSNITNIFGSVTLEGDEAVVRNNQKIVFNETYNENLPTEDKVEPWVVKTDETKRFIKYVGLFTSKTGGNCLDVAEINPYLKPGYEGDNDNPSAWEPKTTLVILRNGGLTIKLKNAPASV